MAPPQRHYVNLKGSAVLYAEEVARNKPQQYTLEDTKALIEALRIKYGRIPVEESTSDSLSSDNYTADDEREDGCEKLKRNKKFPVSPRDVFPGVYYNQTSQSCELYQDARESLRVANPDSSSEEGAAQREGSNGKANTPVSNDFVNGETVSVTPENGKASFDSGPLNDANRALVLLPKCDSNEIPPAEPFDKDTRDDAFIQAEWLSRQKEIEDMENEIRRTESAQEMGSRDPLYGFPQLPDTNNSSSRSGYHANTRNPPPALAYNSVVAPTAQQLYLTPLALRPGKSARCAGRVASTSGYIDTTPSPNEGNGGFRRVSPLQTPPHAQAMAQRAATLAIRTRTVAPELQQAKQKPLVERTRDIPIEEAIENPDAANGEIGRMEGQSTCVEADNLKAENKTGAALWVSNEELASFRVY